MGAYIFCIFSTLLLNICAEIVIKNRKNRLGIFFLTCSLVVLCTVAGVRTIDVGTDIRVYVTRLAAVAEETDFIHYMMKPDSHFLFGALVYGGYLFRNYNILLFIIELAVCLPVYIYAYKEKEHASLTINILIFVLSMYCTSYNLIRQSIAISICILSYHYYKSGKIKIAWMIIGIAVLFHTTALVFWGIYMIRFVLDQKSENKCLAMMFILFVSLVGFIFAEKIISFTSYAYYLNNQELMREFSFGSVLKRVFWVIAAYLTNRLMHSGNSHYKDSEMSIYMFLYALILNFMSFHIPGMGRLGYYFYDFALFLLIPIIPKMVKPKMIGNIIIFLILFSFWWNMTFIVNDSSGVYPYKTEIFHLLN